MKRLNWVILLGAIAFGSIGTFASFAQSSSSNANDTKVAQSSPSTNDEDSVDLKTIDCKALLKADGEEREQLLIFMHGFMSGKKNEMTINGPALSQVTDKIIDACIANPNQKLLGVFEKNR